MCTYLTFKHFHYCLPLKVTLNVERLFEWFLSGHLYVSSFFEFSCRQIRFWLLSAFPASCPCSEQCRILLPYLTLKHVNGANVLCPYRFTLLLFNAFSHASPITVCCVWLCSAFGITHDVFLCIHKLCKDTGNRSVVRNHCIFEHIWTQVYFFRFAVWNISYFHFLLCTSHSLNLSLCVSLCVGSSRAAWVQTDVPCSLQNQGPSIMLTC